MNHCRTPVKATQVDWLTRGLVGLTGDTKYHSNALSWLARPQKSCSRPEQEWFFEHLQQRLKLLELYQDYFPGQWQKSTADMRVLDIALHTERELEFFDHLDAWRFPCEYADQEFQSGMVVYAVSPDWEEVDWAELDCLVQCYVGVTNGGSDWEQLVEHYGLQDSGIETPMSYKNVTAARVTAHCETLTSPLQTLPQAFAIIEHGTGNSWLDSHYMDPETFEWSHATINQLTQAYNEASALLQGYNTLNEWLSTNPKRIMSLVQVWNAARFDPTTPQYTQLELPLVTTISSDQFVRGEWLREFRETRRHYEQLVYG